MANLQTQSFSTTVSNFASAVQGNASALVNFTIGSVLRALADATAAVAMWLQGLIITLLAVTRLSTSSGTDVDSWVNDFGFTRLPAVPASGVVTFARMTATNQAVIPVGILVQSSDGTQQFIINADTTNAAYSATVISGGGFIIPAGTASINATATAITAGPSGYPDASGNVAANTITSLVQAIPYVDTVNNAAAFTNGANPEADAAVRTRFVLWINSLAEGTVAAVSAAILSVQQGLTFTIQENTQYNQTAQQGYFSVVVDDGTGSPPSQTLTNVANAINLIRPLGSTFGVHAPVVVSVSVAMTITTASGYVHATVASAVQTALTSYINTLGLGNSLFYTRLGLVAYGVPGVTEVLVGYTINGGSVDIAATPLQTIKANGGVVVS
jgi:uncharacterized phage protein gp47/JayE